jgi:hypothetical protein
VEASRIVGLGAARTSMESRTSLTEKVLLIKPGDEVRLITGDSKGKTLLIFLLSLLSPIYLFVLIPSQI